jgi:hypothetical protein
MTKIYRVFPIDPIPKDIKERIAAVHVLGILAQRKEDTPGYTQDLKSKTDKRK